MILLPGLKFVMAASQATSKPPLHRFAKVRIFEKQPHAK